MLIYITSNFTERYTELYRNINSNDRKIMRSLNQYGERRIVETNRKVRFPCQSARVLIRRFARARQASGYQALCLLLLIVTVNHQLIIEH